MSVCVQWAWTGLHVGVGSQAVQAAAGLGEKEEALLRKTHRDTPAPPKRGSLVKAKTEERRPLGTGILSQDCRQPLPLTQSHKLTSDLPAGLSEAGNWSLAHLLTQGTTGMGGGSSSLPAKPGCLGTSWTVVWLCHFQVQLDLAKRALSELCLTTRGSIHLMEGHI